VAASNACRIRRCWGVPSGRPQDATRRPMQYRNFCVRMTIYPSAIAGELSV
jgi:hypothetical protein